MAIKSPNYHYVSLGWLLAVADRHLIWLRLEDGKDQLPATNLPADILWRAISDSSKLITYAMSFIERQKSHVV